MMQENHVSNREMELVKLVKPGEGGPEVEHIYDEICRLRTRAGSGRCLVFLPSRPRS